MPLAINSTSLHAKLKESLLRHPNSDYTVTFIQSLFFPRLFTRLAKLQVDFSNYVGMSFQNGDAAKWSKHIPRFRVKTFPPNEAIIRESFTAALLMLYEDDLQACSFNDDHPDPTAGRNRGASPAAARETDAPPVVSLPTYPHALCFSLNSAGFLSQSEWPADYLLWRRETIRRRERYCRYTQWERKRAKSTFSPWDWRLQSAWGVILKINMDIHEALRANYSFSLQHWTTWARKQ